MATFRQRAQGFRSRVRRMSTGQRIGAVAGLVGGAYLARRAGISTLRKIRTINTRRNIAGLSRMSGGRRSLVNLNAPRVARRPGRIRSAFGRLRSRIRFRRRNPVTRLQQTSGIRTGF